MSRKISLDTALLLVASSRKLEGLDLSKEDFSAMNLEKVSFDRSNLGEANFSQSRLRDTTWLGAQVNLTRFDGAQAEQAKFSGSGIKPASGIKAVFDFTDWSDVELLHGNFTQASFINAKFVNVTFKNVNFAGCNFNASSWQNCFVDQCEFTGATFNRADVGGLTGYAHKPHPLYLADTSGARNFNPYTMRDIDALRKDIRQLLASDRQGKEQEAVPKIERLRKMLGTNSTQQEMATALGVPHRTFQDWLQHPQRMSSTIVANFFHLVEAQINLMDK